MPIISNQDDFFCTHHFLFNGNDILLAGALPQDSTLSAASLPDKKILRRCKESQFASDWYEEPGLDYGAMMLEKDCPVPSGCTAIPLRQFFWDSAAPEERGRGELSQLGSLAARAHGFLRLREQYRHCPRCGTLLQVHQQEIAKVCPRCGRMDFPRIEPAVIVLVSRGDELLLVKNKNRSGNFYACVSGFVEHGESLEQRVAREVKEETNITVQNIRYAGSQPWPFPDQLMLAFTAEYKEGELRIQESELDDAGWFRRDALPEIPRPGSVAYKLLSAYLRQQEAPAPGTPR